ncbi:MAG: PfkB family carbohydrate kinase [Ilumatobacteraceae bacterium]
MLCTIGDLIEDVVVWLADEPNHASDTTARISRTRGGSAANVASFSAAAFGSSRFVGQVGDDHLADQLVDQLAAGGVDVCVQKEGRTGSIVVLVHPDGERTMLSDRGACTQLTAFPRDGFDGISALHVPTYSLTVDPLATVAIGAIGEALARGIVVSIDASSTSVLNDFGIGAYRKLIAQLTPDVFMCNGDEADLLGLSPSSPIEGAHLTIIKRGAQPTVAVTWDRITTQLDVPTASKPTDTTGAGDAFAAGFIGSITANGDVVSALAAGHELAARVLNTPGATLEDTKR